MLAPGNFCRGTESAAFASLYPGPSMPNLMLTSLSLLQPGHLMSSSPTKVQGVSDASFGKKE